VRRAAKKAVKLTSALRGVIVDFDAHSAEAGLGRIEELLQQVEISNTKIGKLSKQIKASVRDAERSAQRDRDRLLKIYKMFRAEVERVASVEVVA
jgi:hypothetical protein